MRFHSVKCPMRWLRYCLTNALSDDASLIEGSMSSQILGPMYLNLDLSLAEEILKTAKLLLLRKRV